jgi:hypothetical protein
MHKQKTGNLLQLVFCGIVFCFCFDTAYSQQSYNPKFWVEEIIHHDRPVSPADMRSTIGDVASKGWDGVLFWRASRANDKMQYYKSPFLKSNRGQHLKMMLTPVAAHSKIIRCLPVR